jgi:uncharacterized protein (DUF2267 family)
MPSQHTGARVPLATKVWIKALREQGMALRKIAQTVGHSPETVQAVLRAYKSETGTGFVDGLKSALPHQMRKVAADLIDRLGSEEVQEKMGGRDLAVAAGIMVDKAVIIEQAGQSSSILNTIQARLEAAEAARLQGKTPPPALPDPAVEDAIVVQRCPPEEEKTGAPGAGGKDDGADLLQERV